MNIEFSKSFDKQTSRVRDKILLKRLGNIIKKVIESDSLSQIPNVKSIVGHPGYYRIRLGDFRIGISLEEETVWFHFFGKKDESTYKKFP